MKVLVLQGSPHKKGNTAQLTDCVKTMLRDAGATLEEVWLYDCSIRGCIGCKVCQDCPGEFGCVQKDDMQSIDEKVLAADLILLATPLYCWYCTAPMKAMLDRLIYGNCKYYGKKRLGALLAGKKCALITTCGYPESYAETLVHGIAMLCRHSKMVDCGALVGRDMGTGGAFVTQELTERAAAFARNLLAERV
ncbi:MAG: flavodoxin family protein [Oscillospiraceae bacterium]|nr:flavodoxin family protein [Oscillospiraceae bacterium]